MHRLLVPTFRLASAPIMARLGLVLSCLLTGFALANLGASQDRLERGAGAGYAVGLGERWHFNMADRPVKVVLVAGSIGAWRDHPYARLLQESCSNVEIRNLSVVGMGAPQLYTRFRDEVIRGRAIPRDVPGGEAWLMWNGGLNSAGSSTRTNRSIRRAFVDAHQHGMRVVGLSLSPWGSLADRRWRDGGALSTLRNTRGIVDFVLGRLTPPEALGHYVADRDVPDAPWDPSELADVRVDLYNSPLRAVDAEPRSVEAMTRLLERDHRWRREVDALSPDERILRIQSDVGLLSELPRWFLRDELVGFDPIHPNRAGHQIIADAICPAVPASWGCTCPTHSDD